jgi:hypothetical protein
MGDEGTSASNPYCTGAFKIGDARQHAELGLVIRDVEVQGRVDVDGFLHARA